MKVVVVVKVDVAGGSGVGEGGVGGCGGRGGGVFLCLSLGLRW